MKKFSIMAVAALLVALASSTCFAINAGQTQVNLSGSVQSMKPEQGDSTNSTLVTLGVGYFLKDSVSLGAAVFADYSKTGSTKTLTDFVNAQAKYHFMPKKTVVPYLGVQGGYMGIDSGGVSVSGYDYGAMGGVDFFITENVSLNLELNYRKDAYKMSGLQIKSDTIAGLVGLSYFFGN